MYLHLFTDSPFIDTIVRNTESISSENRYIVFAKTSRYSNSNKLEFYPSYKSLKKAGFRIADYKRVFIHYLGGNAVDLILDNPDFPEYFWFFWGADGYSLVNDKVKAYLPKTAALAKENKPIIREIKSRLLKVIRPIKKRKTKAVRCIKTCCTYVVGDYELIKNATGASMSRIFFAYLSTAELSKTGENAVVNLDFDREPNFLAGNSLNPSNNHIEMIDFLKQISGNHPINVTMPLAYGGHDNYRNTVKQYASDNLTSVQFIDEFLPYDKYLDRIKDIDVAVFFHIRQQGSNNALAMLWSGKILIMRTESTLFNTFKSWGLSVLGHDEVKSIEDIRRFNDQHRNRLENNRKILLHYMSPEAIRRCYNNLYEHS